MAEPSEPSPGDVAEASPLDDLLRPPTWRERLPVTTAGPAQLAAGAAAAVVAAVVVVVLVVRGQAPPAPELTLPLAGGPGDPAASTTTSTSVAPAADVVVHAAGAVGRPGVYRLAAGARVADLLDAAGGPAPGADLDRVNLAAPLLDGERVFVPVPGQDVPLAVAGPVAAGDPSAGGGGGAPAVPVDLNTATAAELEALPGVGPATAQAILDERGRRGGFTTVDDLLDVRGIGEAKLADLRDRVRV